jgi:TRAP-type C4-dicarboxylate transport system substrate-binding protein
MKPKSVSLAALLGICLLAPAAWGQQSLRVSTYVPTNHWLVSNAMAQWAREVEAASAGRLKMNIMSTPLGRPQQHFELARDGIADITLGIPGYTPGRFVLAAVGGIPNAGNYSESLGAGYWRTLQGSPEMQKEYDGTVILSVFSTTPMGFWATSRPVRSVDDFKGLKVHTAGGMMSDVANALGMVPLVQPVTTAYEVLANGVVDAIIFTSDGIASFKLDRLIKQGLTIEGGFTSAQGFLVMNPAKFNALGPELQAVLRKISSENFARIVGQIWDERDAGGIKALKDAGANVVRADPQLRQAIFGKTEAAISAWAKQAQEQRGTDGRKLVASYRGHIAEIERQIRQGK